MPIRTCVACRRRAEKSELLRWVVDAAGKARPDPAARAEGRGRYVCRAEECLTRLEKKSKRAGIDVTAARSAFALAIRGEVPQNGSGETHDN